MKKKIYLFLLPILLLQFIISNPIYANEPNNNLIANPVIITAETKHVSVRFTNTPLKDLKDYIWYSNNGYSGYLALGDWELGKNNICSGYYEGVVRKGPYAPNSIKTE